MRGRLPCLVAYQLAVVSADRWVRHTQFLDAKGVRGLQEGVGGFLVLFCFSAEETEAAGGAAEGFIGLESQIQMLVIVCPCPCGWGVLTSRSRTWGSSVMTMVGWSHK